MPPVPRPVAPHHGNCLGCGPENPGSLGLVFHVVGDHVHTEMHLDRRHEGAPGFAHGGAIATALDDTIGTLLMVLRRPAVTARLEVDYRRPAFVDADYTVESWIERIDGRKLHLAGIVRDATGETVAEAAALFLEVDIAHFQQHGSEPPEHWHWSPGDLPR
ncbi:MAG: Thioesterase family protein [Solirubrobacterales bacterium]|nr:Thioesterase family protein [Solirubrobacterales bacterium]